MKYLLSAPLIVALVGLVGCEDKEQQIARLLREGKERNRPKLEQLTHAQSEQAWRLRQEQLQLEMIESQRATTRQIREIENRNNAGRLEESKERILKRLRENP